MHNCEDAELAEDEALLSWANPGATEATMDPARRKVVKATSIFISGAPFN